MEERGNCKQGTAKIGICTPLKSDVHFRFVSETTGIDPTTFPSHKQNLVKFGEELWTYSFENGWKPKRDTKIGFCTSLKFEIYFRFRRPPSTFMSTFININSVGIFVIIHIKMQQPQLRKCQNWNLYTSKIGNLLPVYLWRRPNQSATTFPSYMQNLVKIGKELRT